MADADLDTKFNKAVWLIRNGPKAKEIDDDTCVHCAAIGSVHDVSAMQHRVWTGHSSFDIAAGD